MNTLDTDLEPCTHGAPSRHLPNGDHACPLCRLADRRLASIPAPTVDYPALAAHDQPGDDP